METQEELMVRALKARDEARETKQYFSIDEVMNQLLAMREAKERESMNQI